MDQFDKNVTFSIAMRNIAWTLERIRDGLDKQNDDESDLLIEYEILICDNLLDFLSDFVPNACIDDGEEEGDEDGESEKE